MWLRLGHLAHVVKSIPYTSCMHIIRTFFSVCLPFVLLFAVAQLSRHQTPSRCFSAFLYGSKILHITHIFILLFLAWFLTLSPLSPSPSSSASFFCVRMCIVYAFNMRCVEQSITIKYRILRETEDKAKWDKKINATATQYQN